VPVSIAGGDALGGSSSATQRANNDADADASNKSKTDQNVVASQELGRSSCFSGCGGSGQEQNVAQIALTKQDADADAFAKQHALNANVPVRIAGGDALGGSSSATQTANNSADADAANTSKNDQDAYVTQMSGEGACASGCGGNGQEQNVLQKSKTKQHGNANAWSKQKAFNVDVPFTLRFGRKERGAKKVHAV
jgi:hypothetical protein